jgi:hypothetical protein
MPGTILLFLPSTVVTQFFGNSIFDVTFPFQALRFALAIADREILKSSLNRGSARHALVATRVSCDICRCFHDLRVELLAT